MKPMLNLPYDYKVDDQNFEPLLQVIASVSQEDYLNAKKGKGLLLYGNIGSGKSDALRIGRAYSTNLLKKTLIYIHSKRIADEYQEKGSRAFYESYLKSDLIIDEIGTDIEFKKNFGNSSNVIEELILQRYEDWKDYGVLTWFSTNLNPEQLKDKYGGVVYSRIYEMCGFVKMESTKDRRGGFVSNKAPKKEKIDTEFLKHEEYWLSFEYAWYSAEAKEEVLAKLREIYKTGDEPVKNRILNIVEGVKKLPEVPIEREEDTKEPPVKKRWGGGSILRERLKNLTKY